MVLPTTQMGVPPDPPSVVVFAHGSTQENVEAGSRHPLLQVVDWAQRKFPDVSEFNAKVPQFRVKICPSCRTLEQLTTVTGVGQELVAASVLASPLVGKPLSTVRYPVDAASDFGERRRGCLEN